MMRWNSVKLMARSLSSSCVKVWVDAGTVRAGATTDAEAESVASEADAASLPALLLPLSCADTEARCSK